MSSSDCLPLCYDCEKNLIAAPLVCQSCGNLGCTSDFCLKPWQKNPLIHSYSAQYLLTSRCYKILKYWKNNQSYFLDKKILTFPVELLKIWKDFNPEIIVPIPQSFLKNWQNGNSTTENIANHISTCIHVPVLPLFNIKIKQDYLSPPHFKKQFKEQIILNENQYFFNFKRILLVDDFKTIQKNRSDILQMLNPSGTINIHIFYLGIRSQSIKE